MQVHTDTQAHGSAAAVQDIHAGQQTSAAQCGLGGTCQLHRSLSGLHCTGVSLALQPLIIRFFGHSEVGIPVTPGFGIISHVLLTVFRKRLLLSWEWQLCLAVAHASLFFTCCPCKETQPGSTFRHSSSTIPPSADTRRLGTAVVSTEHVMHMLQP